MESLKSELNRKEEVTVDKSSSLDLHKTINELSLRVALLEKTNAKAKKPGDNREYSEEDQNVSLIKLKSEKLEFLL